MEDPGLSREARKNTGPRGRPSGIRTTLQERQKHQSVELILDAAARLFREKTYPETSIDNIAAAAKVSRVTIYKHFESKIAIARALSARAGALLVEDYASLAKSPDPTRPEIEQWINRILSSFSKNREVIRLMASITWQEPELLLLRAESYARTLGRLGATIPAFRTASSGTDKKAYIEGHLLLVQLNEFCFELAITGLPVDRDDAVGVLADNVARFIEKGRGKTDCG